jgi:hypothetical protein
MNHPQRSLREWARRHKISDFTVRKFAKENGFKSLAKRKVPLETAAIKDRRLKKAKTAMNSLKKGCQNLPLIFSDKKIFVCNCISNNVKIASLFKDRLKIQLERMLMRLIN